MQVVNRCGSQHFFVEQIIEYFFVEHVYGCRIIDHFFVEHLCRCPFWNTFFESLGVPLGTPHQSQIGKSFVEDFWCVSFLFGWWTDRDEGVGWIQKEPPLLIEHFTILYKFRSEQSGRLFSHARDAIVFFFYNHTNILIHARDATGKAQIVEHFISMILY